MMARQYSDLRLAYVLALCTTINMVDGFDILAVAFTAPGIAHDWDLSAARLGLLFSSGLAGMTLGAFTLSPLADHWGRRRAVFVCLGLITTGMFASAAATSVAQLMAARALTGAGVGAMMPTINTVVAEYATERRRDLAVVIQSAGFPLGAALGGVGVYLNPDITWRGVFVAGGAFSLLIVPATYAWMPAPIALQTPRKDPNRRSWDGLGIETTLIASSFLLLMFSFYFLTNWTPKLLTDYGLSKRVGISGAVLMNFGGVIGDLLFAALVIRWSARWVGPIFMALGFITACGFAFVPLRLGLLLPVSLLLGVLLFGSMASLYAMVARLFPASLRVTGTGIALGTGRMGATLGPYVGGVLISLAWDRATYLVLMALPLLACAAVTLALGRRTPYANGCQPDRNPIQLAPARDESR